MKYIIPLYKPFLGENERKYLLEAFDSGWISSRGKYVKLFEEEFAKFVNRKYALTVCNGTVALHLALEALKLKKGTAVLCPSLTYVSSANAIRFSGLVPVFVDCDKSSGISTVEHFKIGYEFCKRKNIAVSAVMPVHLYGAMLDMNQLISFCSTNGLKIVEDAAESFGSFFDGKICGSYDSDFTCYSFFGNKTITTGEGGMIVCNDEDLYDYAYMLRGVGQKVSASQRYNHVVVGYNYRMTNLTASIGLGQLQSYNEISNRKEKIANKYRSILGNNVSFLNPSNNCISNNWLVTIGVPTNNMREGLMLFLESKGVETRPAFLPMHAMVNLQPFEKVDDLLNSEIIGSTFLNLPSFPELTEQEVIKICSYILEYIKV